VKSLIEILNECGVVDNHNLESKWRAECDKLHEDESNPARGKRVAKKARKVNRKAAGGR
jgi:hypothetical protein